MSLMSKLLTTILISTFIVNAGDKLTKNDLENYAEAYIIRNSHVDIEEVKIIQETTHPDLPGWKVYLILINIEYMGQQMSLPQIIFFKDGLITEHLVSIDKGRDYANYIKPPLTKDVYNDKHLIYGDKDAAHKVVVFSDPRCPFCQEIVPDIFKAAKAHPKKLALYYYHLPLLRIHPASGVLTRIMHIAQAQGRMDVFEKMYTMKIDEKETNTAKILAEVKKQTGFSVTEQQINEKSVTDTMNTDAAVAAKLMVGGTPTVFVDGQFDPERKKYKEFIK